jgi:hypothetical protein
MTWWPRLLVVGTLVALGLTGVAAAQVGDARPEDQTRARQRIFMMEGVLERAVQLGVDSLRRRVRAVMPDDALLQGGAAQVRGFPLDGYGLFFDVEVPALRQSLAWSMRTMRDTGMSLARDLAQIRSLIQAIEDPRAQAELDRTLRRIQQQIGPTPSVQPASLGAGGLQPVSEARPGPVAADADPVLVNDPNEAYTDEVKAALIDAMIENSAQLGLREGEWLTVAARDNTSQGPLVNANPNAVTLVLRISGADVSAFRTGRLTLQEARSRVQVTTF